MVTGIICEYNPFHTGHRKQIARLKADGHRVVCLMSGNFVQRGAPAIFDKALRAKAAVLCGADLVLELPTEYALSSAEGFAAGGVEILSGFCDFLCFGTETGTVPSLTDTACALLSPEFPEVLRRCLETGISFPAARQAAMEEMGCDVSLLRNPNDILAIEYTKAILSRGCAMKPLPIHREGSYHDLTADPENPSATALRELICRGQDWRAYTPPEACPAFDNAAVHTLAAGERAILARLRTMTGEDFEALPYSSEGLWRKLMHACRSCASVEEIASAVKSKRYTRSRIDRMILCAFLGITAADLSAPVPYVRVLAFSEEGKAILKNARKTGLFPHTGEQTHDPYWIAEKRRDDLYGLFCLDAPSPAGQTEKRRVFIVK